jgi:hypothetical protein
MISKKQNEISDLPSIPNIRYENIFRVYKDFVNEKGFYYYNITNKISLPNILNNDLLSSVVVDRKTSWTTLSYIIYGNIYMWYLLFILNKTQNKFFVSAGETIVFIKNDYINIVINSINE